MTAKERSFYGMHASTGFEGALCYFDHKPSRKDTISMRFNEIFLQTRTRLHKKRSQESLRTWSLSPQSTKPETDWDPDLRSSSIASSPPLDRCGVLSGFIPTQNHSRGGSKCTHSFQHEVALWRTQALQQLAREDMKSQSLWYGKRTEATYVALPAKLIWMIRLWKLRPRQASTGSASVCDLCFCDLWDAGTF